MSLQRASKAYNISQIGTQSILIVCYGVALWVITKHGSNSFAKNIIIMMIISCIGADIVMWANLNIESEPPFAYYVIVVQGVGGIMRDCMFNVSHWLFAFQYYNSAV